MATQQSEGQQTDIIEPRPQSVANALHPHRLRDGRPRSAPAKLSLAATEPPQPDRHLATMPSARHLSLAQLVLLTICLTGVQFTWTVELAYGTPYLLSLGLAKSLTALVWIAGPLSGLLIQPIVGVYSDRSTFRLGRRRPYMLVGGLIVAISVASIAYSTEMASSFVGNSLNRPAAVQNTAIGIAVVAFYFLDFSINAVQASCRALIVDIAPLHQQEVANAWGGRMIGVGNVIGYFIGYLDLPKLFPFLGDSQIKVLCVIAIAWFSFTLALTCIFTREKPYIASSADKARRWWRPLLDIVRALAHLPRPVQSVCNVQFLAWLGWFPFLFYSSSWVADKANHGGTTKSNDHNSVGAGNSAPTEEGTRAGSLALLIFAIISVITGFVLPMVAGRNGSHHIPRDTRLTHDSAVSRPSGTPLPTLSRSDRARSLRLRRTCKAFFTLPRIWAFSLWSYTILMTCTFAVSEVIGATLVIAMSGIPWGVMQWVPFTLMGECVSFYSGSSNRRFHASGSGEEGSPTSHINATDGRRRNSGASSRSGQSEDTAVYHDDASEMYVGNGDGSANVDMSGIEASNGKAPRTSRGRHATVHSRTPFGFDSRHSGYNNLPGEDNVREGSISIDHGPSSSRDGRQAAEYNAGSSSASMVAVPVSGSPRSATNRHSHSTHHLEAGMVLGIHNIYIVLPQFVSTLLSAIVFAIIGMIQDAAPPGSPARDMDAFGWTLRLGAFPCIWAGLLALRVEEVHGKARA